VCFYWLSSGVIENRRCYCRGLATESRVRTRGELSRLAQTVLLYTGAHKVLYQCLTTFCSCQNPTVEREYKANAPDRYDLSSFDRQCLAKRDATNRRGVGVRQWLSVAFFRPIESCRNLGDSDCKSQIDREEEVCFASRFSRFVPRSKCDALTKNLVRSWQSSHFRY
jgi:hypothetical protein